MIDLNYPIDPAKIYKGSPCAKSLEMLPICNEFGVVSSQASREFCHANRLLHPVVRLSIIERSGNIILQLRSADTVNFPLKWDFAAAGHIVYGEDVNESLRREACEEIGLTDFNPICLLSYVYEDRTDYELVNSFAAVGSFEYRCDHDEVADIKAWSPEEIAASLGKGVFTPSFEYEYPLIADKLQALL